MSEIPKWNPNCISSQSINIWIERFCNKHFLFQFYGEDATIPMFVLLTAISFILLALTFITVKVQEVSDYTETFLKIG